MATRIGKEGTSCERFDLISGRFDENMNLFLHIPCYLLAFHDALDMMSEIAKVHLILVRYVRFFYLYRLVLFAECSVRQFSDAKKLLAVLFDIC